MSKLVISITRKQINVLAEGLPTIEEAQSYVSKLKNIVSQLDTSTYSLIVDAKKMAVTDLKLQKVLSEAFILYKNSNFRDITIETGNNSILKMQFDRIANQVGLEATIL